MPKKLSKKATKGKKPSSVKRQKRPQDFLLYIKREIAESFSSAAGVKPEEIVPLIERPPQGIDADFAVPCFVLAKELKKSPQQIAQEVSERISPKDFIKEVKASGPYVNFLVDWNAIGQEAIPFIAKGRKYGSSKDGKGKTIVVDFSSPNVAKPMSVGHLRSTVIGDSLCRIHRFLGYKVIGDNHLGDWGTQFGKIIVAYQKWGSEKNLRKNPIEELLRLYVKFHDEAEVDKKLDEKAREIFRKLEEGDKRLLRIWKRFVSLSKKEFEKTYRKLGVKFDLQLGESFYNKMARDVIREALKKGIGKWSEGALILDVGMETPLIIQKSDEATLYSTRDLATIKYRIKKFRPERILYVIGSEQKEYMEQVFRAAERLGYINPNEREKLVHVHFGMVSLPEGKISTRKGRIILLDHLIEEAVQLAEKIILLKNPKLKGKKKAARQVGTGAIKYADLSRDRIKDIRFDWNEMLSFEGDTGPYIQYTHARACSILRKGKIKSVPNKINASLLSDPKEKAIIKKLCEFPEAVRRAAEDCKPHYIANYVYSLATLFNEFYQSIPVLKAEKNIRAARVALVIAVRNVLKAGLGILGIEAPDGM